MKWSIRKYERLSSSYERVARKKGYKAQCVYNDFSKCFYFMLEKGDSFVFNSLWRGLKYVTEEECMNGCELYIDMAAKGMNL